MGNKIQKGHVYVFNAEFYGVYIALSPFLEMTVFLQSHVCDETDG